MVRLKVVVKSTIVQTEDHAADMLTTKQVTHTMAEFRHRLESLACSCNDLVTTMLLLRYSNDIGVAFYYFAALRHDGSVIMRAKVPELSEEKRFEKRLQLER